MAGDKQKILESLDRLREADHGELDVLAELCALATKAPGLSFLSATSGPGQLGPLSAPASSVPPLAPGSGISGPSVAQAQSSCTIPPVPPAPGSSAVPTLFKQPDIDSFDEIAGSAQAVNPPTQLTSAALQNTQYSNVDVSSAWGHHSTSSFPDTAANSASIEATHGRVNHATLMPSPPLPGRSLARNTSSAIRDSSTYLLGGFNEGSLMSNNRRRATDYPTRPKELPSDVDWGFLMKHPSITSARNFAPNTSSQSRHPTATFQDLTTTAPANASYSAAEQVTIVAGVPLKSNDLTAGEGDRPYLYTEKKQWNDLLKLESTIREKVCQARSPELYSLLIDLKSQWSKKHRELRVDQSTIVVRLLVEQAGRLGWTSNGSQTLRTRALIRMKDDPGWYPTDDWFGRAPGHDSRRPY